MCCCVTFNIISSLLSVGTLDVRKKMKCKLIPGKIIFHISSTAAP